MEQCKRNCRQYLPKGKSYEMRYAEKCNKRERLQFLAKLNYLEREQQRTEQLLKREKISLEADLVRINMKPPEADPHRCLKRIRREQVREWLEFIVNFQVKTMEKCSNDKKLLDKDRDSNDFYLKEVNTKPIWKRPVSSCNGRLREKTISNFQLRFTKAMDSSLSLKRCRTSLL